MKFFNKSEVFEFSRANRKLENEPKKGTREHSERRMQSSQPTRLNLASEDRARNIKHSIQISRSMRLNLVLDLIFWVCNCKLSARKLTVVKYRLYVHCTIYLLFDKFSQKGRIWQYWRGSNRIAGINLQPRVCDGSYVTTWSLSQQDLYVLTCTLK